MATKERHLHERCPTCRDSTRRGLIKLAAGGRDGDWVECPDCGGTGIFEMVERLFVPTSTSVLVPGRRNALPAIAVAQKVRDHP